MGVGVRISNNDRVDTKKDSPKKEKFSFRCFGLPFQGSVHNVGPTLTESGRTEQEHGPGVCAVQSVQELSKAFSSALPRPYRNKAAS